MYFIGRIPLSDYELYGSEFERNSEIEVYFHPKDCLYYIYFDPRNLTVEWYYRNDPKGFSDLYGIKDSDSITRSFGFGDKNLSPMERFPTKEFIF